MKRLIVSFKKESSLEALLSLIKLSDVVEFRIEDQGGADPSPEVVHRRTMRPEGKPAAVHLFKHFGLMKHFTPKEAQVFVRVLGYAENTAASTLSTLAKHGYVGQRPTDGWWYFKKAIPDDFSLSKSTREGATNA